jgi:NAD(P)-dependent dehydrogenase (short-subunit alcohol dehydrogenase family)
LLHRTEALRNQVLAIVNSASEMESMDRKICIVTGSNSGIGKQTAMALADNGAHVVMIVRSEERGEEARQEIIRETGNESIDMLLADLSSMEQIRNVTAQFKEKYDRLDVLINNAGAIFWKRKETDEGFEMTFALNHLAPFLLTYELIDVLLDSEPSRIVNVSSGAHTRGEIDFDDLQSKEDYGALGAYSSAKLMTIAFTYAVHCMLDKLGHQRVVPPETALGGLCRSQRCRVSYQLSIMGWRI